MIRVAILVIIAKTIACIDEKVHEKYLTMPREEFIEYFNSQNFSWKITEYNKTFAFGNLEHFESDDYPKACKVLKYLPQNFDAREKWPQCETIKEIYNQGKCGSCWTFGSANSASDRTCIHKDIHVHLAEQDLQCLFDDPVCKGGVPLLAIGFWSVHGLVSNKCKPYDIEKLKHEKCKFECVDKNISYIEDKHFADSVYTLKDNVDCIKSELFQNGPVEATFRVFDDFVHYHGGIYEHKFGNDSDLHSVRVIGYGVEDGKEYWLAANSWGKKWGEKGFFRIKTKQDEIAFENRMATGLPKN